MTASPLGDFVQHRRRALGLTQWDVATRMGRETYDQSYVSKIETGKIRHPEKSILNDLARALDLTAGEKNELYMAADYAPERWEDIPFNVTDDVVDVLYRGRFPADALRWVEMETESRYVSDIPRKWIGTRTLGQLFVIEASGDCLMRRGIVIGTYVLCEHANGVEPDDDQVVAVRVGDERSLKVWHRRGGTIELLNGDKEVVYTLGPDDDVEVYGYEVTHWWPTKEQRLG